MKFKELKYLYLTLIVLLLVVTVIIVRYYRKTASNTNAKIALPGGIKSILFVGDSNTAANFSYADQLHIMYPNIRIKKIAENGAKTDWMLTQLQKELSGNSYDVVIPLGGSNDIYALDSITSAKANLNAMYLLAHARGSRVIAVSPPNKDFYTQRTDHKQQILRELVDWIKLNPNKDSFIDFWTMTNNKALFSASDGYLHAQKPAHLALANDVSQILKLSA